MSNENDKINPQTPTEIYDRLAEILSKERLNKSIRQEFKQLIIDLEQKFSMRLTRELFFKQYFRCLTEKENYYIYKKYWKIKKAIGLKETTGIRYFSNREFNKTTGEICDVKRREILTIIYVDNTGTETLERGSENNGN